MLEGSREEFKDIAAIGITSDPNDAGGLPAPEIEVTEMDGESEYCRPSFARGTLLEDDMRPPWVPEVEADEDP
jgi:hypothetical protein